MLVFGIPVVRIQTLFNLLAFFPLDGDQGHRFTLERYDGGDKVKSYTLSCPTTPLHH